MGVDLLDVLPPGAGLDQQVVVDLQPDAADDAEIVLHHQVVNGVDAAGGAVFQGQHAVAAEALFNGGEHCLKGGEEHGPGQLEQLVAGQLRVSSRHALAGHRHIGGEQLGGVVNGGADLPGQRGRGSQQPVLVAAAQLEEHGVEGGGVVLHVLRGLGHHVRQLLLLPGGVQHRKAPLLFAGGDSGGGLHPLGEKLHQLVVDPVDLYAIIAEFHGKVPPKFNFRPGGRRIRRWPPLLRCRERPGERCRGHAAPRSAGLPASGW